MFCKSSRLLCCVMRFSFNTPRSSRNQSWGNQWRQADFRMMSVDEPPKVLISCAGWLPKWPATPPTPVERFDRSFNSY